MSKCAVIAAKKTSEIIAEEEIGVGREPAGNQARKGKTALRASGIWVLEKGMCCAVLAGMMFACMFI